MRPKISLALLALFALAVVAVCGPDSSVVGLALAVPAALLAVPAGGKRRRLTDEAAKIHSDLSALRLVEPSTEEESATLAGRVDELAKRADVVAGELEREAALDLRMSRMVVAGGGDGCDPLQVPRGVHSGGEKRANRLTRFGKPHEFESDEAAESVGKLLRGLRDGRQTEIRYGDAEIRDGWSNAGTATGAEYGPVTDLYNRVINKLNYSSKALQLAFVKNTNSNRVSLPKPGAVTFDFIDENTAATAQTPATSAATLNVYDARGEVGISNNLLDDSPIDVAMEFSDFAALGAAQFIDNVWLSGHSAKSIGGLYAGVSAGRKTTVPVGTTMLPTHLQATVGAISPLVPQDQLAWVVSPAGWGQLLTAGNYIAPLIGGQAPVPQVWGAPVHRVAALPTNVLALYGNFNFTTAIAARKDLTITPLREVRARENMTVFLFIQRFGLLNHAPEYCAAILQGT